MSSVVISGDTSGSITVAAPAVAGTNTITLPAYTGTAALTSNTSVLISTTTIANASTTTNVTSSMTSAGWYQINMTALMNASTNNSTIVVRTSSDNGATFDSGATNYSSSDYAGSGATASSLISLGTGTGNATFYATYNIFMYSGSASAVNAGYAYVFYGTGVGPNFSATMVSRNAFSQVNAIQLTRTNGTRVFTGGTINVYYLGQG